VADAGPTADDAGPSSLGELVRAALALGARSVAGWSEAETALAASRPAAPPPAGRRPATGLRARIEAGEDPLGEAFARLLTPRQRRPLGQTYTPAPIVAAMVGWAQDQGVDVTRVVDPGAGSGRYLLAAGRRFPHAELVGSEIDPLAALLARANLAAAGLGRRGRVVLGDFRDLALPPAAGPTLYLGNPPYVRHHQIPASWKRWLVETARARDLAASGLAGLHAHFFLAVAAQGAPGDLGAFITSAEWLDVNYGSLVRDLLLGDLGGTSLHILAPESAPFADATTTGVIVCFRLGERPSRVAVRRVASVAELGRLSGGHQVPRQRLAQTSRWSVLTRIPPKLPSGHVELGELFRVHRGAVTGANSVWVTRPDQTPLPPSLLYRAVTRARELFEAGERLRDTRSLRVVIGLPADLDVLDGPDREIVLRFLAEARERNVHRGYIASTRKAWWSVQLRDPAPILATYMARRPPAFVRNDVAARHINIAHGLYPRQPLEPAIMDRLTVHLRTAVTLAQGRTYAGGLTKFEPKEMERLPIPGLPLLTTSPTAPDLTPTKPPPTWLP
jgi:adenine-specific DNA-methyltransferase